VGVLPQLLSEVEAESVACGGNGINHPAISAERLVGTVLGPASHGLLRVALHDSSTFPNLSGTVVLLSPLALTAEEHFSGHSAAEALLQPVKSGGDDPCENVLQALAAPDLSSFLSDLDRTDISTLGYNEQLLKIP
jgi:hypothetical protein